MFVSPNLSTYLLFLTRLTFPIFSRLLLRPQLRFCHYQHCDLHPQRPFFGQLRLGADHRLDRYHPVPDRFRPYDLVGRRAEQRPRPLHHSGCVDRDSVRFAPLRLEDLARRGFQLNVKL